MILGAGLDTFAWRQPEWAARLAIFEIDHGESQKTKRGLLESAEVAPPPNLEFVAIDFESGSLRDGLLRSSFNFHTPAFFSWLGVMMYLTEEAVDAVFGFVGSLAKSTEIAFTFAPPDSVRFMTTASAAEEPFRFYSDPESLDRKLKGLGFSTVFFPSPEELAERYFRGRTDLPVPKRRGIGCGVV